MSYASYRPLSSERVQQKWRFWTGGYNTWVCLTGLALFEIRAIGFVVARVGAEPDGGLGRFLLDSVMLLLACAAVWRFDTADGRRHAVNAGHH